MSLHRTLFCLLCLTSILLASEQDVLKDPPSPDSSSSFSRHLVSKTFSYGGDIAAPTLGLSADNSHPGTLFRLLSHFTSVKHLFSDPAQGDEEPHREKSVCLTDHKRCANTCIPLTQDCCSASTHCSPEDYCFHYDGELRCCPKGLRCFTIGGDVWYAQRVLWYEEVHIHFVDVDDEGQDWGEELAVVTERRMESSVLRTATRITVTASYPSEGRSEFERISRTISREAETRVVFDAMPTRTRSITRTVERTSSAERKLAGSEDDGDETVFD